MISKTFNRYIWLLNILMQRKKMTFEDISEEWQKVVLVIVQKCLYEHFISIEKLLKNYLALR